MDVPSIVMECIEINCAMGSVEEYHPLKEHVLDLGDLDAVLDDIFDRTGLIKRYSVGEFNLQDILKLDKTVGDFIDFIQLLQDA